MESIVITGAKIVNEGQTLSADVLIKGGIIERIDGDLSRVQANRFIQAEGLHIFPGAIDDQVHFREPGLTHKATIATESAAAVAGGVTSFMEMPNTVPNTLTQDLLEQKYQIAAGCSPANYSFFMGASNDNLEEVLKTPADKVCGVKIFMGSSTGNMLVDKEETLRGLFSKVEMLIATHCEDEATIRKNTDIYKAKYGEDVPFYEHPNIRSEEACYLSSSFAVGLAKEYNTRLHILHISTAKELGLFDNTLPLAQKRITSEACIHHLWFSDQDYVQKGALIKWNPAVKRSSDREAILQAVLDNRIDVIATDHAPHTWEEKQNSYFKAPSGGPLVQHSLVAMLDLYHQGKITLEKIAEKMSHHPAILFRIKNRGFIREGYAADLALVNLQSPWQVKKENILAQCGWSPFEGHTFQSKMAYTLVNGQVVYENGRVNTQARGQRLSFHK
ncbi:dihydroorotase [Cytophagales bacterium LB-30]|uniref:Dihydroorotase n=1 Tax=Shiella aurantiaca TaxID=3058365 RepID=A0ABT8F698_9BACT|nr:dihydroorotase [Shiella aurantiaca]MDN4165991.1 dihydroorotase [Shiella aurantiaca]